ncbi:Hypothetical predicted protein, partial [Olea europaea subsp. europaea]
MVVGQWAAALDLAVIDCCAMCCGCAVSWAYDVVEVVMLMVAAFGVGGDDVANRKYFCIVCSGFEL